MIRLDVKDRKIISELDMDARLPLSKIAKKVGLSREVVHYRIKQLENNGIIEGYYAAIDVSKLGLIYCRIFLKYRQMSQEKEKELMQYCKKSSVINWVTVGDGKWNIVIVILVKNIWEIESTYDDLNSKFGKHFQNPYISIAYRILHFKHNYLYDKIDDKQLILGEPTKVKIDELDYKLMEILSKDGRMSLQDISKKLEITSNLVAYRIKNLIKGKVIIGFRAKINVKPLGYDHYKVLLTLQDFNKQNQNKLLTYLKSKKRVIYITKSMGQNDLEFEIIVKKATELHEFMRELSCKFPSILVNYETILYYVQPILKYLPKQL